MSGRVQTPARLAGYVFAGAILGAAGLGALSGSVIGESPILAQRDAIPTVAGDREPILYSPPAYREQRDRPPDHYDLETPSGVVPVSELALHGRLRDRQLICDDTPEAVALDADYTDMISDAEIERLASGPALSISDQGADEFQSEPREADKPAQNTPDLSNN